MSGIGSGFIGSGFIGRALTFLTPSYWRSRASFPEATPRAAFAPTAPSADITATPTLQATITPTPGTQLTFDDLAPQAGFPPTAAVAVIEDPDPTATIVT